MTFKPKLDLELKDMLRACEINIKFVFFKTPQYLNREIRMPKKVFFTAKFFTKRQTKTGNVSLRLPKAQASGQGSDPSGPLLANQQYFLMRQKATEESKEGKKNPMQIKSATDMEYESLRNDLEIKFDFDPSLDAENAKAEEGQHKIFCEYLYGRNMTIDIWNGESMMHFGSCKIPLQLLMRQGQPLKTIG